jgi:hypothetical protein
MQNSMLILKPLNVAESLPKKLCDRGKTLYVFHFFIANILGDLCNFINGDKISVKFYIYSWSIMNLFQQKKICAGRLFNTFWRLWNYVNATKMAPKSENTFANASSVLILQSSKSWYYQVVRTWIFVFITLLKSVLYNVTALQ